jgi:5'-3' exonuclease
MKFRKTMPTIYLIDASPYIFRAYFAIPASMRAPDGTPTNAVRGYTAFLLDLLKREQPTHLAVAFDGSLTTSFRNEIYPNYKARRELPDPELEAQLNACWEVTQALGLKAYIDDRYEADDLIGTIIAKLSKKDCRFVVVSGDKDLAQLVNKRTVLWDFAKDRRFDEKAVKLHFGLRPDQIVDLLALQGDAVDNIPGVKGIGAKTAVALLEKFAGINEIYRKIDRVERMALRGAFAIRAKLEQGRGLALLSKQLATIAIDAPIKVNLRELKYSGADRNKIEVLFERLGFGKIRERIPQWRK